jgi:NifB/MoaA-like Fe-S oxidoreductase
MPQVIPPLQAASGARFDILPVRNTLFGPRVTTAGLLAGADLVRALREERAADLALLPGEALNDDQLFIDGMPLDELRQSVPMPVRCSRNFADALDG